MAPSATNFSRRMSVSAVAAATARLAWLDQPSDCRYSLSAHARGAGYRFGLVYWMVGDTCERT